MAKAASDYLALDAPGNANDFVRVARGGGEIIYARYRAKWWRLEWRLYSSDATVPLVRGFWIPCANPMLTARRAPEGE